MNEGKQCVATITEDIIRKVRSINTNNLDKTNRALAALYYWEDLDDNIESITVNALMKLQTMFHKDDSSSHAGMAKLGSSTTSIGQMFTRALGIIHEDNKVAQFKDNAIFGSVFIETLQDLGYVVIDRNYPGSAVGSMRAPLVIHATDKWAEVGEIVITNVVNAFLGVSFKKPKDVSTQFNNPKSKRPLVKRTNSADFFIQLEDTEFLKGVNGMQQTGWRINADVLQAIIDTEWNNSYTPIPKEGNKKDVDDAFKVLQQESIKKTKGRENTYEEAQQRYERLAKLWAKKKYAQKERSRVIERQITVSKAIALADKREFFFYVEADYRGRLYYAESFLNYQSNDIAKGLLEFSEGKLLDKNGLKWLLIHAASSYNYSFTADELRFMTGFEHDYIAHIKNECVDTLAVDKMALCDRVKWAEDNISFICKVAREGLIDNGADKPIIFLSACMEINKYLIASKNGDDYYSHLPIPVDGQTNGSQHAAAINRDHITGQMVGLTDKPIPADLYVAVGKAMVDLQPEFFESRQIPMRDIRKNISKRSCMVRQYSAGASSISDNMFSDCWKTGAAEKYNISAQDCDRLAKKAIIAIDTICPSNAIIRGFLQSVVEFELGTFKWEDNDGNDVSRKRTQLKQNLKDDYKDLWTMKRLEEDVSTIEDKLTSQHEELSSHTRVLKTGNGNKRITWISPSGFPVICKLFQKTDVKCQVSISKKRYTLVGKVETPHPDIQRHMSSIAANFIHSRDAAHMALTISSWFEKGNNFFGGVHDSFSVHASDVDSLVDVIKDEFIKMHSSDNFYLETLENILTDTSGFNFKEPDRGTLDLESIRNSTTFFS